MKTNDMNRDNRSVIDRLLKRGYQPKGKVDTSNPPKGGSGVVPAPSKKSD